jgi:hypothetical protein
MSCGSSGLPKTRASPPVAGRRPVSIFIVVDLPQPLEPTKPKISPRRIRKLTRSTATKSPKRIVRSRASMAGGVSAAAWSGAIRTGTCPRRRSSGSSATKAASSELALARARISAGVPLARTAPPFIATSQSNRCASSM